MAVYPERRKGRLTGKWVAEVPLHGKRQRGRFDTKREADQWEGIIKLTGELPAALTSPMEDLGPTLDEVARQMWADEAAVMDRSGRQRLEYAIDFYGRDTAIRALDTSALDRLVRDLRKRPGVREGKRLSPGTINRYLSAVSGLLTYAKRRKVIPGVPDVPWQEDDGKRLHWATEEQEAALVAYMVAQGWTADALATRVLAQTGMRWSEFAGLTPDRVEPETGWIRLWETKNGTVRSVPIDGALAAELKALVAENGLPNYSTYGKRLKRAAKSAGLNEGFSIHALRHTTATRLIAKQVPLPIAQKYLGHKAIQTTMKYVHVADEDLKMAAEKISPHAGQIEKAT